jgi:hypothetical protein
MNAFAHPSGGLVNVLVTDDAAAHGVLAAAT